METNMKKLLALLMALMMCCTAFAFAEEEAEVPAVEMNVSFEAQTVALGDTGLTMQIPADWAVQEVPAGTENAENILQRRPDGQHYGAEVRDDFRNAAARHSGCGRDGRNAR